MLLCVNLWQTIKIKYIHTCGKRIWENRHKKKLLLRALIKDKFYTDLSYKNIYGIIKKKNKQNNMTTALFIFGIF